MKNSSDTVGNRTRDIADCSAVSQPTAQSRAPFTRIVIAITNDNIRYGYALLTG